MGIIKKDIFICIDCETTGLDPDQDKIIEVGAVRFTLDAVLGEYESLIDPECLISPASMAIHHITDEMVQGKPKIGEILHDLFNFIGKTPIVGHGVGFDIQVIAKAAERNGITTTIKNNPVIDTLRMARLYGESRENSLEALRQHFSIQAEGAHRAMSDVLVNIEVFRRLATRYKTTESLLQTLSMPVQMRAMPLGKHKGRPFKDIPVEYLQWASHKDFDQDLLYSIRTELKRRKKGNLFQQAANPFSEL